MDATRHQQFELLPSPASCKLIDFDLAEVVPGFVTGTWILVVSGKKPWANMQVNLYPLVYITQPDYWGIEVVACLGGIGLPAEAPYTVALPIDGFLGTDGIEVIGATHRQRLKVSGRKTA